MYMRDLWDSLARRWTLVAVCLLATIGLTYYVSRQVPPTYEARADVVLVPPKSVEEPTSNRYLSLGGLRQAVDVLTRSLSAEKTQEEVEKVAPDGTFETTADVTTSAPILIVTATAATAAEAQKTLDGVLSQIPITLRELQESVDIAEAYRITPQVVASDEQPKAVNKKQIRVVAAVAVLLLLMSAMLVGAVDNRLLIRQRAKEIIEQKSRLRSAVRPTDGGPKRAPVEVARETRKRDVVSVKVHR
jgi:uncharacterized protein involved in exopolysaccharide biosynthesis